MDSAEFLQRTLTGYIAMMLAQNKDIDIDVTIPDEDGVFLSEIHVTGRQSGARLRIPVEIVE